MVRLFAIPVRARRESSNRYLPSIFVDVPVIRICSGGYLAVHCSVSVYQWERRRYSEVINCYVDSVSIRSMWNTTRGHPCSRGCAAAVVELKAMTRERRASTSKLGAQERPRRSCGSRVHLHSWPSLHVSCLRVPDIESGQRETYGMRQYSTLGGYLTYSCPP